MGYSRSKSRDTRLWLLRVVRLATMVTFPSGEQTRFFYIFRFEEQPLSSQSTSNRSESFQAQLPDLATIARKLLPAPCLFFCFHFTSEFCVQRPRSSPSEYSPWLPACTRISFVPACPLALRSSASPSQRTLSRTRGWKLSNFLDLPTSLTRNYRSDNKFGSLIFYLQEVGSREGSGDPSDAHRGRS